MDTIVSSARDYSKSTDNITPSDDAVCSLMLYSMLMFESQTLPHTLAQHSRGAAVVRILEAAMQAVEPQSAVRRFVQRRGQTLLVDGHEYSLDDTGQILLLGLGKASHAMTLPLLDFLSDHLPRGLLIPNRLPSTL